jgi:hypothetical protein
VEYVSLKYRECAGILGEASLESTLRLPGLKSGVCSGLILSGALNPDSKIGVWRHRTYQNSSSRTKFGMTKIKHLDPIHRKMFSGVILITGGGVLSVSPISGEGLERKLPSPSLRRRAQLPSRAEAPRFSFAPRSRILAGAG